MIEYVSGDIFASNAAALVNPVNCVGVMGKGLALQFKTRYPGIFLEYRDACRAGLVAPGRMFVSKAHDGRVIIHFPTKRHWGDKSRLEDIRSGLVDLRRVIQEMHIPSVAIPAIGAGLGGLPWEMVKQFIEKAGLPEDAQIMVFEKRFSR